MRSKIKRASTSPSRLIKASRLIKKKGAPSKQEIIDLNIDKMCRLIELGSTNEQIAVALGVSARTIWNYKHHDRFLQAVEESEKLATSKIKCALFQRAVGYKHKEMKVFCNSYGKVTKVRVNKRYPPDTNALNLWLNNKDKDWKPGTNQTTINNSNSVGVQVSNKIAPEEVTDEHKRRVKNNIRILRKYGVVDAK